jgi:hypothetical protein
MWVTPDGRLAMRLPGSSPSGGLDAGLVTPDTPLVLLSSLVEAEGEAPVSDNRNTVLGDIAGGGDYPLVDWVELEPDTEPIVLNVPSG